MGIREMWLYWYVKRRCRKMNIRRDGYSQYGQDRTVFEVLGGPAAGVFLDIGANDGVTFSNSLLFEQHGWEGICVEPHPQSFAALANNRNCHLVNACVADQDGTVNFLVVEGPANMLSGIFEFMDERHLRRIDEEIGKVGGSKRLIEIEAISPQTLLKRFHIDRLDYLSIDTEGCELKILKTFDFEKVPARIIGIENGARTPELFRYLASIGYRLEKCVGCDELYLRER